MTFGSLFAGIGGFDLGFERAGMTCKWQVEIDEYCRRVLEKHWPSVLRFEDVRDFPPKGFDLEVDTICAGFPCQDISYAGNGAGINGERSGLFFEAMRVIRALGPRFVVLENVVALLTRGMGEVLGSLASCGYDAAWDVLAACDFGAPHIRERVFVVACRSDSAPLQWHSFFGTKPNRDHGSTSDVDDAYSGQRARNNWRQNASRSENGCSAMAHADVGVPQGEPHRSGEAQPNGESRWATEPDVGRVAYGVPSRVDRLRGLGNSIVPDKTDWIGRRIMEMAK